MRISDWSSDVCSSDLGRIGNVPLLMSDAAGSWRFANGKLSVQGGLQVADTAVPSRFNPLLSKDFALDFNGQRITALGTLIEPRSRSRIMKVDIAHDLGSGAGQADLLEIGRGSCWEEV